MRGRLLALTVIVLATAGCATQHCDVDRPIPGMDNSRHVEQINAGGSRSWN
jgi:hypothetical protein